MSAAGPIAILVPVKDLTQAKTRLASLLSLEERRTLATLLLEGVLRGIATAQPARARVVVSSYAPAIALARSLDYTVLEEARQVSESASVDAASAELQRRGLAGVLRVPLDLPAFDPAELGPLLDAAEAGAAAVLVPSRDGTGTNALYRAPPTLFPSRFGPDSLRLHEQAARGAAGPAPDAVRILPLPGFALDIDEPADVAELLRRGTPGPALDYLRGLDATARLARLAEPA